jgi:hypothetical protein
MVEPNSSPNPTPTTNNVWHAPGATNVANSTSAKLTVEGWRSQARQNAYGGGPWSSVTDGMTDANRAILCQIYTYYGTLHQKVPDKFHWAGLAKLAGGAVVSGLDMARKAFQIMSVGADPSTDTDTVKLMQTAQNVFEDIAWQFEAYTTQGIGELRALLPSQDASAAKGPDGNMYPCMPAWEDIDKGADDAVRGAHTLLQHEQKVMVQFGLASMDQNFLTNRAGAFTLCPHPYGRSFSVVEPQGQIANQNDRWNWVETDMWPQWKAVDAGEQARIIGLDFSAIVARNFGPLKPQYLPPGDGGEDDD